MIQEARQGNGLPAHEAVRPLRLAIFGAPPDTPNMGVTALFYSAIAGIAERFDKVEFVVFDCGLGERTEQLTLPAGQQVLATYFGARMGRRYYRPENLATMAFASKLGRAGAWVNRAIALVDSCDAVLDISGGDSFSDIYGRRRFYSVYVTKAIAKARRKPLFLLPQTYGPYNAEETRRQAADIARAADMAWARDADSMRVLQDLLGDAFDPDRHRSGVDMAFGLEPCPAEHLLTPTIASWLKWRAPESPLIGFNVSGLVYLKPDGGAHDFGLKADYRRTVVEFLRRILTSTSVRVVLVPHVMDPCGHHESDLEACNLVAQLLPEFADRITVSPLALNAREVKWLIAQMDWFCGTRMHSTIAGLSSGVPTAAISYSDKTRGVFRTCSLEAAVFDPRALSDGEIVESLLSVYDRRHEAQRTLRSALPMVRKTLEEQFDLIAASLKKQLGGIE